MTHRVALSPFSISCAILFAAPIVLAQNEDFATVKQLVEERFDSIESYSADVKTRMNLGSVTMNFGGTIRGKGAMSESISTLDMFGQQLANRTVVDAQGVTWTEMNMMGEKLVSRSTRPPADDVSDMIPFGMASLFGSSPAVPGEILTELEKAYSLTTSGRSDLNGVEVIVIEGQLRTDVTSLFGFLEDRVNEEDTAADGFPNPMEFMESFLNGLSRVRLQIGVADGFPRKVELMSDADVPTYETTYENVQLNQTIDDDKFAYTPPDGVEVTDLSSISDPEPEDSDESPYNTKIKIGDVAPEFEAPLLSGGKVKLSDYRGKVVLLDFWAKWCGPCMAEIPNLIEVYSEFHERGFDILGVNMDGSDASAKEVITEHPGMAWINVFEGEAWDSPVVVLYGVNAIPYTLLLDQGGKVIGRDLDRDALKSEISRLLEE